MTNYQIIKRKQLEKRLMLLENTIKDWLLVSTVAVLGVMYITVVGFSLAILQ